MTATGALRVAHALLPGGGLRATRLVERNLLSFRKARGWLVILSGFYESLLYLLGMGIGVGALVGTVHDGDTTMRYQVFAAPALMASAAMNGAVNESIYNVYYKLRYAKLYDAVLSTPLTMLDVAVGEVAWALMRSCVYAMGFVVVMAMLGMLASPWAALAVPAALLESLAFAGVGIAVTTWVRSWNDFAGVQLTVMLMFLLSGTFYPVSSYPGPAQVVVQLTPLYHGVHLLRSLTTGTLGAAMAIDGLYLAAMGGLGVYVASRRMTQLLLR